MPHTTLCHPVPRWCYCSGRDIHLKICVIIRDESSTLAGDIIFCKRELNQLVRNGTECICKVKPQHRQVNFVLSCSSNQLCYHKCILQTSWHFWNIIFLDRSFDVGILTQVATRSFGNNAERDFYIYPQQDDAELVFLGGVFLLRASQLIS